MDKAQAPKLRNLAKRRLDASGFSPNAVAFCHNLGLLCLGDKEGVVYLISLAKHRLILKFQLKQPITALKYVSPHKALFIVSGPKVFKFDFKKSRVTMDRMMEFWPSTAEYIEKHNAIGFAGDTFSIHFYDMNLKYQFSINYNDPSRTIGSLLLLEKQNVLLVGLDDGTIAVYDMNTTRLTWQDRKQMTPVNYIKYIEKEDILLSGAKEGKLFMRQLDKYQGFKTRACTWMKKSEILGMIMLKDGSHMACIHADINYMSIVRIKDWQVVQKLAVFYNNTGGTNLVSLGEGNVVLATEKGEGFYYLMKSM